jgi:phosphoserine/homoserine phosphotransferase
LQIVCLDLEGVLVPEIWIAFSERTGIAELRRTTRDEPDYDKLMRSRLELLRRHRLGLRDIQRIAYQVVILSDTFYEFAMPLMAQLGFPTLFCHRLEAAADGFVTAYHLRLPDQKRAAVKAFKDLNFKVIAGGDSYNDTAMLGEAHAGILFRPPQNVMEQFPQYPVVRDFEPLRAAIDDASARIGG